MLCLNAVCYFEDPNLTQAYVLNIFVIPLQHPQVLNPWGGPTCTL